MQHAHIAEVTARGTREARLTSVSGRGRRAAVDAERALVELLRSAHAGDDRAWERLHARFTPGLRSIARSYRLSPSDVDDVVQTAWMRLIDHIGRLRDPAVVASWLATTTRRECLRLLQAPVREYPTDDPDLGDQADRGELAGPEAELLAGERQAVLGRALETLPERHRELMTMLVARPAMDYRELSTVLAMPVGSIGPIRARSLARLRHHPELRDFCPCAN